MEALIMSCSTGGGHNAAAQAVADEMARRGHHVTMMDPYELAGKSTARIIGNSYVKLVQKSPKAFGAVYALGEAYRRLPIHSPVYLANERMAACTQRYLSEHHYDVIVMSHIFPAHILTNLKKKGMKVPPTVLIATDYTCIPFMEEAECDHFVIPAEDLREEFCERGIPRERILPFGIPVRRAFGESDAAEARRLLGFAPRQRVILLSGGSIGAGSIEETVETLLTYMQTRPACEAVIVCGNNEKLFESLTAAYGGRARVRLLQSTTQMAEYMRACDLFISKPGGLSSTEAAACGTPMIHISPIPGCETKNALYFSRRGMSLYAGNPRSDLLRALTEMESASAVGQMKMAQRAWIGANAAERLCRFLEGKYDRTEKDVARPTQCPPERAIR